MSKWFLSSIEVNGGFLPDFSLTLPPGLTCIIGPRGSGKSTLVEAIRFAVGGLTGASKPRADLIQGNLAKAALTLRTSDEDGQPRYVIRRTFKQAPSLTTPDGRPITADLDRGTFLSLDGYSSSEIEAIADELGEKRRVLLDELVGDQLRDLHIALADHRRALSANGDRIRAARASISDSNEMIEELSDARAKLMALPSPTNDVINTELASATRQDRRNTDEVSAMRKALAGVAEYRQRVADLGQELRTRSYTSLSVDGSANLDLMHSAQQVLLTTATNLDSSFETILTKIDGLRAQLIQTETSLQCAHLAQRAELSRLRQANAAESEAVTERTLVEQRVAKLEGLEQLRVQTRQQLMKLLDERKELKSIYLTERERISDLRESVATNLQSQIGDKVRVQVIRGADDLAYTQMLNEGLRGAGVRNHEGILDHLVHLRPEALAQIIQDSDLDELEQQVPIGQDRCRKILDAFREKIDPLNLEIVDIDDRIRIELNVGSALNPIFKDASVLSRGQKCTALLPLLIARRGVPIVIDQPEDNLDNHFIYETVVDTIVRSRGQRQMIFITHNANIPVLGEADLVVVLNSDGTKGYIEQQGNLDDCRDQIIDLLEGGRDAFELRRKRYGTA